MIVTGIGSRHTPGPICELFTEIGREVHDRGWWLRSGHSEGADYAFEQGALERCIVYMPWATFNKEQPVLGVARTQPPRDEVLKIVYKHEPYAKDMSDGVKLIKSRNVYQILGIDLQTPSDLVICWTPEGGHVGGTALALRIAKANNIPVINLGNEKTSLNFNNIMQKIAGEIQV